MHRGGVNRAARDEAAAGGAWEGARAQAQWTGFGQCHKSRVNARAWQAMSHLYGAEGVVPAVPPAVVHVLPQQLNGRLRAVLLALQGGRGREGAAGDRMGPAGEGKKQNKALGST